MTRNPCTLKHDTSLSIAVSKMIAKPFVCLPVLTDDGAVCGILAHADLLKSYQMYLEAEKESGLIHNMRLRIDLAKAGKTFEFYSSGPRIDLNGVTQ
jgi:predicted transcriptional regulator